VQSGNMYRSFGEIYCPRLLTRPVMGKLFKEGAKGKEKNFRRANIIYLKITMIHFTKFLYFFDTKPY